MHKILKDILNFYADEPNGGILTSLNKLQGRSIDFHRDLAEIQSIVYKVIISEGLFPIYCEINTMDDSVIKIFFLNCFIPEAVLPWSSKFHVSFLIGDLHYSFTPNNKMNTRLIKNRKYLNKNYNYIRIKLLDFFPLDKWIVDITDFFINHALPDVLSKETQAFLNFQHEDSAKFKELSVGSMASPMEELELRASKVSGNNDRSLLVPLLNRRLDGDSSGLFRNKKLAKITLPNKKEHKEQKTKLWVYLFRTQSFNRLANQVAT